MSCEHCGANEYWQENWPRIVGENQRLRAELERVSAEHAITRAKHTIKELEQAERQTWEQGKVHRQRARIKELEALQAEKG